MPSRSHHHHHHQNHHHSGTAQSTSSASKASPARRHQHQQQATSSSSVHSVPSSSTSSARLTSQSRDNSQHPFRIEVQDVTPISISLRWSLRPPPISNLAAALSSRAKSDRINGQDQHESGRHSSSGHEDAQGEDDDDDATAVDGDGSDRDEDVAQGVAIDASPSSAPSSSTKSVSTLSRIFDSGFAVTINGTPWSQVVMGDQGADESVVVIYGLSPNQEYDLEMIVGSQARASRRVEVTARVATASANGEPNNFGLQTGHVTRELESGQANANSTGATEAGNGQTALSSLPASENGHDNDERHPPQSREASEIETAEALRSQLTTELRQARKEASRAEQALRNEIEAIKRSLERMSSVDHRSKQKVLALQESIRQGNQSAKEIGEEAEEVDKDHPKWESEADELAEQEAKAVKAADELVAANDAKVKEDEEVTAAAEKELTAAQKLYHNRKAEVEKLASGRVAELEQEVAKLEAEVHRIKNSPTPPLAPPQPPSGWQRWGIPPPEGQAAGAGAGGGYRSVSGPSIGARGNHRSDRGGGRGSGKNSGRNLSGSHYHRRGRGGGSSSSTASYGHPFQPYGPSVGPNVSNIHQAPFASGDTSGFVASGPMGPSIATSMQTSVPPNMHQTTDGQYAPSPSTYLNPTIGDFVPSAHASPVITKKSSLSPLPGSAAAAAQSSAAWGPGISAPSSSDHSPSLASGSALRHGYSAGRLGMHASADAGFHGLTESPTHSHGPHFSLPPSSSLRRDSSGGPLVPSSPFSHGRLQGVPINGSHLGPFLQQESRRPSFGPLDYTDDSAFDPTAPGPTYASSAAAPRGANPSLKASPWTHVPESVSPSLGGIHPIHPAAPGAAASSPWSSSSPILGSTGLASGTGGSNGEDIWSGGPPLGSASASRALRNHPSLLIGSTSVFGHPHRSGSGSSSSTNSGGPGASGGQTSTPASPTAAQRAGSFGAIGGGKTSTSVHPGINVDTAGSEQQQQQQQQHHRYAAEPSPVAPTTTTTTDIDAIPHDNA